MTKGRMLGQRPSIIKYHKMTQCSLKKKFKMFVEIIFYNLSIYIVFPKELFRQSNGLNNQTKIYL